MKQFGIVFCLAYIIVFIVLKFWEKPNMEFFFNYQATDRDIEKFVGHQGSNSSSGSSASSNSAPATSNSGIDFSDIAKERELFERQQKIQAKQNEEISLVKKIVDDYRNDLIIIQNKNKDEMNSIMGDSITQAVSMNGGNNNFNSIANGNSGRTFNLNFDLDDEE